MGAYSGSFDIERKGAGLPSAVKIYSNESLTRNTHFFNTQPPQPEMSFTVRTRTQNSRTAQQQQQQQAETKEKKKEKPKKKPASTSAPFAGMHHGRRVGSSAAPSGERPANPMLEAAERRRREQEQREQEQQKASS